MSYYKQNKDIIIKKILKYYHSEEQKIKRNSTEWKIKQQRYQHEYYLKRSIKRRETMRKKEKIKTKRKKKTKPIKDKSRKRKEYNNLRRVNRYIKNYRKVINKETLEIEFD